LSNVPTVSEEVSANPDPVPEADPAKETKVET